MSDSAPAIETTGRLRHKMLMVLPCVMPSKIAVAFVMRGLLSEFDPDEVAITTERREDSPPDQTHDEFGHPVYFVSRQWTWPRRGRKYIHWLRWLLFPLVVWRVYRVAKREKCRAVLANFPDEMSMLAGGIVARLMGLKLFPYLHNTYYENRHGLQAWFAYRIQRWIFNRADIVFVMSSGMQTELQKLWPGIRFEPLIHTNAEPIPEYTAAPPLDPQRLICGMMGSINASNYDALRRLVGYVRDHEHAELRIFSNASKWFLESRGFLGPRVTNSSPENDELLPRMCECDLLLLPHGFEGGFTPIEYATIFPTRVINYLMSQRPIVAHSPRGCFFTNWLREHDCAEIVDLPDPQLLADTIERLARDPARREQLVRNGLKALQHFDPARVVRAMKDQVNAICEA